MTPTAATALPPPPAANPWLPQPATLIDMTPEVAGVATYRLRLCDAVAATSYHFRPGQFNMLYLPGFGEAAISLSGAVRPGDDLLHTIRTAGNVTRRIAGLRPGDVLGLRGPFGNPWPLDECEGRDLLLVAGGIGLAPLRPVLYHVLAHRNRFGDCTLVYGARSPDLLLYQREFAAWSQGGIRVLTTVDRADSRWQGAVGVVTLLIDRLANVVPSRTAALICGPELMMTYALRSAQRRGIPSNQIWLSLERNMQCAMGLCGRCQYGPSFVCKDGPVLRVDRLEPLLAVSHL